MSLSSRPPTLLPLGVETWNCKTSYNFDEALATQPDAVMMLRVQRERMSSAGGGFFPSPGAYHSEYGLTPERFAKLRPDAVVMHPGPMEPPALRFVPKLPTLLNLSSSNRSAMACASAWQPLSASRIGRTQQ